MRLAGDGRVGGTRHGGILRGVVVPSRLERVNAEWNDSGHSSLKYIRWRTIEHQVREENEIAALWKARSKASKGRVSKAIEKVGGR